MPNRCRRILFLGDTLTAEMQPLANAIAEFAHGNELRDAPNSEAAIRLSRDDWFPDLTIVFQNRPDEFTTRDVARLLNAFPLARLVCCYGFWCESDGRNRDVWPPAIRITARAALPRIRREFQVLENGIPALPITAGRDEVFAFNCPAISPLLNGGQTIGVVSPDRSLRCFLHDLLDTAGYFPRVNESAFSNVSAVAWDADPLTDALRDRWRQFTAMHPAVPIVALSNAPIELKSASLTDYGIASVVPKLATCELLLESLHGHLHASNPEA